ncbi:MAG: L-lactate dehydrogenase complex protein LldF, partial [Thermoleophilaceae bacterium]|nr:L-lactate dehydrogenase complex protein LldF [Thermoleophilaceae bacterium]
RGLGGAPTLPWASSLCGACYDACPVKIDIPSVLVHLRGRVVREERARLDPEGLSMKALAGVFASRRRYETAQRLARLGQGPMRRFPIGPLRAWANARELPEVAKQPFRDWWRSR